MMMVQGNSAAMEGIEPDAVPGLLEQENSGAGIDGGPPVPPLQDQNAHDHNSIPIPEIHDAAAVEEQEKQKEEAMKIALGSITTSASAIITIGIAANQISEGHKVYLKICGIPFVATFLLGVWLIGLASFPDRIPNWSKIVKAFKWMTLGVLVLAILGLALGLCFLL